MFKFRTKKTRLYGYGTYSKRNGYSYNLVRLGARSWSKNPRRRKALTYYKVSI